MNFTREQFEQARALLAVYVDDEPCWLDHHGTCQAHLAMLGDRCANAEAKELLTDPAYGLTPEPDVPTWQPDDDLEHTPAPRDPHAFDDVVPRALPQPDRKADEA